MCMSLLVCIAETCLLLEIMEKPMNVFLLYSSFFGINAYAYICGLISLIVIICAFHSLFKLFFWSTDSCIVTFSIWGDREQGLFYDDDDNDDDDDDTLAIRLEGPFSYCIWVHVATFVGCNTVIFVSCFENS